MRRKNAVKAVAFVLLFFVLFQGVSKVLISYERSASYPMITRFYDEPADSLDVIYVGASGAFVSWCPPLAWEKYGMTSWTFGAFLEPLSAAKYLIEETRKTQPDAVYVISLNLFAFAADEISIHRVADYMPFSMNKMRLIRDLSIEGGFSVKDRVEFYAPFFRYHSRWNELQKDDFYYVDNKGLKSAYWGGSYGAVLDVADEMCWSEEKLELSLSSREVLEDLLSYCQNAQLKVLFTFTPESNKSYEWLAQKNTVVAMCRAYGFDVIDQIELYDEIGLNLRQDFFSYDHVNIHGAVKTTNYLAQYLAEYYHFEDKRGQAEYSSWDEAYGNYTNRVAPYVLDVEWQGDTLDSDLEAPALKAAMAEQASVVISWEAVNGADGYCIYRKFKMGAWKQIASVGADDLSYTDVCDAPGDYTYTVIPYQEQNDSVLWGQYDYTGVRAAV